MPQNVVELYAPERLRRLSRRRELTRWLLWALGLGALIACVVLTAGVNSRNIYDRLKLCVVISVAAAWLILYFGTAVVRDGGRVLAHAANLKDEPRQTVTGRVTLLRLRVQIRSSVELRKVRVDTDRGPVSLSVLLDWAGELPHRGELLRLYVVHGYITAYEVVES